MVRVEFGVRFGVSDSVRLNVAVRIRVSCGFGFIFGSGFVIVL